MTFDETKQIVRIIASTYPNFKMDNAKDTVSVWAKVLENDTYKTIEAALYAYIRTDRSGFAPTPGQLLGIQTDVTDDGLMDGEAWALVRRAISDSTWHSEERYNELPETVQRAVGSHRQLYNWATDEDFNESVIQSQFIRAYHQVQERKKMNSVLPERLKDMLAKTSEQLALEGK